MNYISLFYAQGEDAETWLNLFETSPETLLVTLTRACLLSPPYDELPDKLNPLLHHEFIGDFVVTYDFNLGYIGVCKPAPMGELIDIKA